MKMAGWGSLAIIQIYFCKINLLQPIYSCAERLHAFLISHINSRLSPLNWFYKAILFGDDSNLRQQPQIEAFMVLGIYHIIVVSGSHLTMIQSLTEKLLSPFS